MTESGFTLVEILFACVLLGVLAGAGIASARPSVRVERCARTLTEALSDAHQRARMDRSARSVAFDGMAVYETSPRPRVLARLPRGCRIERTAFGVGGSRSPRAAFYATGVVSPGSIAVSAADGVCRVTQALYGNVTYVCRRGRIRG